MLDIKIEGLGDLEKAFDEIKKKVNNLSGEQKISEMFPDIFMEKYADYKSIDELVEKSGRSKAFRENFEHLRDDEAWNDFIRQHTRFESWSEMIHCASANWLTRQLGLD